MPGIDLSTLTAPELRQLLRLARARRDGLLIDRLEWEMAQRAALSSRVGFTVERKPTILIEDGDVTIDEVRAFRRPEPGLQPKRSGAGGRLAAGLVGLVAGSVLTAGAFAATQGTDGWRLPPRIALPAFAMAERPAPPRKEAPPVRTATSDAVAGALAPEPFPEVAVAAPPPPPPPPPEPVVETVAAVEPPPPEPPPKPKIVAKAKPKSAPAEAKPKARVVAKAKPGAKPKTQVATAKVKDKPAAKTKLAAKAKPREVAAKTKLAAKAKPVKVAAAKAKPAKAPAKTAVAKKEAKPAAAKAKPKAQVAQGDAIGVLLAARDAAARE